MDILITNGCSFSECHSVQSWPMWLARAWNMPTVLTEAEFWPRVSRGKPAHLALGMGSQGNGQIYRRTQNILSQCIAQGIDLDRIGVAVQWSGPDRWDYYADVVPPHLRGNTDGWMQNPVHWPRSDTTGGGWVIANHHWHNSTAKNYYRHFHSEPWAQIQTMEHVLSLQNLCWARGIRCYSFAYTAHVFDNAQMRHPQVAALCSLVRWNLIDITGEWNWVERSVGIEKENLEEYNHMGYAHPTANQHQQYAERWVLRHLNEVWGL